MTTPGHCAHDLPYCKFCPPKPPRRPRRCASCSRRIPRHGAGLCATCAANGIEAPALFVNDPLSDDATGRSDDH